MGFSEFALRGVTDARAFARKLGLLGPLSRARLRVLRALGRQGYELAFDAALEQAIELGDVVWDVGANVGIYTKKFSSLTGGAGQVWAFEPVPSCFRALSAAVSDCENVRLLNVALGAETGKLPMRVDEYALGSTHTLATETHPTGNTIDVEVWRGDDLLAREGGPCPNVVKIDVEGFEEEVVKGLSRTLSSLSCRAVLMEIHFGILEGRGERHAPSRIKRLLEDAGYVVGWTDASHLVAHRKA